MMNVEKKVLERVWKPKISPKSQGTKGEVNLKSKVDQSKEISKDEDKKTRKNEVNQLAFKVSINSKNQIVIYQEKEEEFLDIEV